MKEHARVGKLTVLNGKPPPFLMRVCFSGGPTWTRTRDQRIMSKDTQKIANVYAALQAVVCGV